MNPLTGPHKTKAKKFKLTEVTGRTIAYASVQVGDFHVFFVECLLLKSQDLHCTFLYESVGLVRQCIQPGGILRLNHYDIRDRSRGSLGYRHLEMVE